MRVWKTVLRVGLLLVILPIGCGDDVELVGPPTLDPEVDTYLRELPSWAEYSPLLADVDSTTPPTFEVNQDEGFCAVRNASLTQTPEDIVTFSPDAEIMWLGSLIQGKGHADGLGSLRELPIRQRGPVRVYIDLLYSDNIKEVYDPDLASIGQAIGKLIDGAQEAGHNSGSSIFFNQVESHSFEQSSLKLGLSASYLGASAKASLQTEKTSTSSTLTATFIQKMFTTSIVLPQSPGDMFSPEFTSDLLQEQIDRGNIGPDNLPVYVGSITWGRMLMLTMTSESSASEMRAALEVSSAFVDLDAASEHAKILQNSEIKVVTIGGHAQAAIDLIRTGRLDEFFKDDAPLTTARPISYTLRNLGDNSIAKVSETTDYAIRECEANAVQRFDNVSEWERAVSDLGLTPHEIATSPGNLVLANEVAAQPSGQTALTSRLTFEKANTGLSFDFRLTNTSAWGTGGTAETWGLVFADNEIGSNPADRWVSIGDADGVGGSYRNILENDDFDIEVLEEDAVYAIGIAFGGNTPTADEYIRVRGQDVDKVFDTDIPDEGTTFVGFVAPFPITILSFDEDDTSDDIAIRDFRFATKQ
jgi:hypothetical protein